MKAWNRNLLIILCFLSCHLPPLQAKTGKDRVAFRIGFIYPRSGRLAAFGDSLSQGVKLGLQQFRAENPRLGEQISLIAADDHGLASEAEKAATRLIQQQKVHLLIGSLSNITNQALVPLSRDNRIILIMPKGTDPELLSSPFAYSMSASDLLQGQALAEFALKSLHQQRAAVLIDPLLSDGEVIARGFSEAFVKGGGQVLGQWNLDTQPKIRQNNLSKMAALKPEVIIFPGSYTKVSKVLNEAKKAGLNASFLGSDGWDDAQLFREGAELGSQHFFSFFHTSDAQASVQSFIEEYELNFNKKPDALAALGYDAIKIALQAYLLAKSNQTEALQKSLEGARFPSIYGAGRFSKNHIFIRSYPIMSTAGGQARLMSRITPED